MRPVGEHDYEQVRRLAPELLTGMPEWRPEDGQRDAVAGWVDASLATAESDGHAVFVAAGTPTAGGHETVLGFVSVAERTHFTGQREAYVGELVVHPDSRKQGVARVLMDVAEDWGRQRGLARIALDTGSDNIAAVTDLYPPRLCHEQVGLSKSLA